MLAQLLGDHPSVSDLPRTIYDRCDGNPFFVEEVVYSLVDQGVLVGERQHYQLTTPIPQLAVPATVQAVLEARIDQLNDSRAQIHRQVAEAQLGLGNFHEAIATLEKILAWPELAETRVLELSTQLTFARALLRAHGSDAADAIQEAISSALLLLEETGARAFRPVVHRILAEVAQAIGDEATRRVQLETAHRLYREMGATGHAEALAPEISLDVA